MLGRFHVFPLSREYQPLTRFVRDDWAVKSPTNGPIRVMRIIARMNVGGPAVQVSGLMRGFNSVDFDHRLYTGFCAPDESDYLNTVATDVKAVRIEGFGRRVSLGGDIKAFVTLVKEIRSFKPHVIHTHTAKAGFLGRIASVVSLQQSIRVHTFHGHLLNGYFGPFKRALVVFAEKTLAILTDQLLAVGSFFNKFLFIFFRYILANIITSPKTFLVGDHALTNNHA